MNEGSLTFFLSRNGKDLLEIGAFYKRTGRLQHSIALTGAQHVSRHSPQVCVVCVEPLAHALVGEGVTQHASQRRSSPFPESYRTTNVSFEKRNDKCAVESPIVLLVVLGLHSDKGRPIVHQWLSRVTSDVLS